MKNVIKAYSVNCETCNREVHNYQIRPAKVGSRVLNLCTICHASTDAYKQFVQAAKILNELHRVGQLNNDPQVIVEPIEPNINAAVNLLKRMDSNYFVGIKKIVAGPEANYGHVSSKEPDIIHINLNRILNETKKDDSKRNLVINIAISIAHEAGHVKSFDGEKFVGGESPAQAEENKVSNWIKANESKLQDLFA